MGISGRSAGGALDGLPSEKTGDLFAVAPAKFGSDNFYRTGWSLKHEPTFLNRVASIKAAERKFPLHRYIFAADTPHEVEQLTAAGIRAEFLNENAFIDEYSFQSDETVAKEFDAVLDAQIAPYNASNSPRRSPACL